MSNITTQFDGTDGSTRANFNQKIVDINAHGNDLTAHVTQAKQDKWDAAVQSATINGVAVPKSGTALQLPAYPVIPSSLPANGGTAADTTSITSALTLSTVAPSAVLPAGTLYGVY